MSVLIKGMEMPSCCDKCPFKSYVGSDYLKCRINGIRFYVWKVGWGDKPYTRHDSCPLTEIPPHGDLIDRDELLSQYGGPIWTAKTDYAEGLRDVVADIKYAPTIIEAEPPSGCEDCKYWDGERCANSNREDCHNSILWWPKEGRE